MTIDELQEGYGKQHLEDMEKEIYVDGLTVSYSGPFSLREFLQMVDRWVEENKYYKDVQSRKEKVTERSRSLVISLFLQKPITAKFLSVLEIKMEFSGMTDHEAEIDGRRAKIEKGDVEIVFNGFLMSSIKARWETQAGPAFIKGFIDKFVYKLLRPSYEGTVVNDSKDLAAKMSSFLGTYEARITQKK